jgi:hypothetical protein
LVSAALLGTARRPVDPEALPEPVRANLSTDLSNTDPERTLLAAAALLTGYRRAGRLPDRDIAPVSPAPPDGRELVGPAARYRLARLLFGDYDHLLPEWLGAVTARGLRVPPERLPVLADVASGRPELRAPMAAVAGPRGPWLAALRPEWAFLAELPGNDDPKVWQFGTVGQRVVWLTDLRATDPDRARAALDEVWAAEPAPVRAEFLGVLRAGLSTSDERFLELALDDRARDVRRLAAELLAALPGSALGQRMAGRLRPLLSLRRRTLVVRLPDGCDDAARRDGVSPAPPRGVGERAWWLGQLVSLAPLSVWTDLAGSAAKVVALPVEGCDPRLLAIGWAAAAVRERNPDWAHALLAGEIALGVEQITRLITVLPSAQWAKAVAEATRDGDPSTALFTGLPVPWPAEVGTMVLDRLARARDNRAIAHLADLAAYAAPVECLDHPLTTAILPADASPWRRRLADTLIFRREMYKELS